MRAGRDSSSGEHVAGEYPKAVRAAVIVNGDMFVEETRRSAEMQREIRIHRASGDRNETGKDHEGSALRWDSDRIMYRLCSAGGCVLVAASRPQTLDTEIFKVNAIIDYCIFYDLNNMRMDTAREVFGEINCF